MSTKRMDGRNEKHVGNVWVFEDHPEVIKWYKRKKKNYLKHTLKQIKVCYIMYKIYNPYKYLPKFVKIKNYIILMQFLITLND